MTAKFGLGRIVATPGALQALQGAEQAPMHFPDLHVNEVEGNLCADDRKSNDETIDREGDAVRHQPVFKAYLTRNNVKLWVITDWGRSTTTLLLPEEYFDPSTT